MDASRAAVYATVGFVVVVTVASGPLVGAVTVPESGVTGAAPGTGDATISVVTMPDRATVEAGEFGTDAYHLDVPPAVVEVSGVTGKPILTYSVSVDGLKSRSSVHFLRPDDEGELRLSMERMTFAPEDVSGDRYTGELRLVLRGSDTERTLYREEIVVEVQE